MKSVDRILAISDIHGENQKFLKLLKTVSYDPTHDLLIVCGDMVDRGAETLATIETCKRLREEGAIILKGNHEQFMEQAIKTMLETYEWRQGRYPIDVHMWRKHNGGAGAFEEIKELLDEELQEILAFLKSLPCYYEVGSYFFSHAGANTSLPPDQNREDDLVWMSDSFQYCPGYAGKVMVFGHIPTWNLYPYPPEKKGGLNAAAKKKARIWYDDANDNDKIGIDCGSVFGGRLAALELPSGREFYV
jgi:serine/threonine protein phosphatase 1